MPAELITFPTSETAHRIAVAIHEKAVATEVATALRNDRDRTIALLTIASQAARLGVPFNTMEAVESGMTADDAREYVMIVAAEERV